jgi:hypothetical protein
LSGQFTVISLGSPSCFPRCTTTDSSLNAPIFNSGDSSTHIIPPTVLISPEDKWQVWRWLLRAPTCLLCNKLQGHENNHLEKPRKKNKKGWSHPHINSREIHPQDSWESQD